MSPSGFTLLLIFSFVEPRGYVSSVSIDNTGDLIVRLNHLSTFGACGSFRVAASTEEEALLSGGKSAHTCGEAVEAKPCSPGQDQPQEPWALLQMDVRRTNGGQTSAVVAFGGDASALHLSHPQLHR